MKSPSDVISNHREPLSFSNQPVSKDLIAELIQASKVVPYAFHLQPTHYYVVTEEAVKEGISKACFNQVLVRQTPAIIVFTGDRFCAKDQEAYLQNALEENTITIDDAEKARHALQLHFDISPLGFGWLGKLVGGPILRLFTPMPQLPAVHKREFLTRQVMRSVMTFFWAAESHGLNAKILESYDEWRMKRALNIPWHQIVVSVMLVGYSQERANTPAPIDLDEVVHWNKTS